ncbi:MAG TPA: class II aldolase/adducin family protein [Syntrophorhabdales bacterium]|nr:class II aldolase/adducin family protein [Syntrophorhabdales bacterium]
MTGQKWISARGSLRLSAVAFSMVVLVVAFLAAGPSFGQGTFNPSPKTAAEAIDQLVWANRILANEGIFDFLGHISVRNPENSKTFFIASHIAPETVTRNDILEVDFEGNVVTKSQFRPYSERIIHAGILKARPDVNSVIHAHPIPVVTLSVSEVPFRMVSHPASIFYEGVPTYDAYDFTSPGNTGMLVTTKEEGDRVAKTLGKSMAMIMRGHGCNVVGKSVPDAVRAAISFRDNVVILLGAQQFGKVKTVSFEEAKEAAKALSNPERGWNAWVARVKRAMPDMR